MKPRQSSSIALTLALFAAWWAPCLQLAGDYRLYFQSLVSNDLE